MFHSLTPFPRKECTVRFRFGGRELVDCAIMRVWLLVTLMAGFRFADCQTAGPLAGPVQATVVVSELGPGQQGVVITLQDPAYPLDALKAQVADLGKRLGVVPTAVDVFKRTVSTGGSKLAFVTATFDIGGLASPETGSYRLQPIAQMLAEAPAQHAIQNAWISFEGVKPLTTTIKNYESSGASVKARYDESPPALEFYLTLKTGDPDKIEIPDKVPAQPSDEQKAPAGGANWVLYIAIAVAGVAAGALVYFALIRGGDRTRT